MLASHIHKALSADRFDLGYKIISGLCLQQSGSARHHRDIDNLAFIGNLLGRCIIIEINGDDILSERFNAMTNSLPSSPEPRSQYSLVILKIPMEQKPPKYRSKGLL